MRVLGLTGYAGSGKDAAAAVLVAQGWHRVAFADKVRALALAVDPLVPYYGVFEEDDLQVVIRLATLVEREGWDRAKRNPEVRRLLQAIGTGVRGVLGEETWIEAALGGDGYNFDGQTWWVGRPVSGIVVTDVRYANEAQAIRDRGGVIVRVLRPGVGPANGHPSETGVTDITADRDLLNGGTLDDLARAVEDMMFELSGGPEHGHR